MKQTAEVSLGKTLTDAVVTVPAYFNDSQRRPTIEACALSHIHVRRIINESSAAVIAYGFEKNITDKRNILIFYLDMNY